MESAEKYTLTFFDGSKHDALDHLGTVSGRDIDKMAYPGFTPKEVDGAVYFEEATLSIVCKKLYKDKIKKDAIIDQKIIDDNYDQGNYHFVFVGEIISCLEK